MANLRRGESADLFDIDTGEFRGVLDGKGREQMLPTWADSSGTALVRPDGTSTFDQVIARRVLDSIIEARGNNASELGPWNAPANWVAATTYRVGNQVQGIGAGVGNLYQLHSGTSSTGATGTSAGATGPTTRAAAIVDNTCVWTYAGPVLTTSTLPGAPTFDITAKTDADVNALGLTKTYGPWILLSALPDAQKYIRYLNGIPGADPAYAPGLMLLGPPGGGAGSGRTTNGWNAFEFLTDAPLLAIFMDRAWSPTANGWNVEVNGRFVYHGLHAALPTASVGSGGTPACLTLDMTGMPIGSVKKVRIYTRVVAEGMNSVRVAPAYSIWKPPTESSWTLAVEGDSLIDGGNTFPNFRGGEFVSSLARRIGCNSYYANAVGGTGFTTSGSGKTTYLERVPELVTSNPDVVLMASAHNGTVTQASVTAWVQAVRAALPNTLILLGGSLLLQNESVASGTQYTNEQAVMAAAAAMASDPLLKAIPVLTEESPWFYGATAGNAASPAGGSGDRFFYVSGSLNDQHPMWTGYEYAAIKYAAAIEEVCRDILYG